MTPNLFGDDDAPAPAPKTERPRQTVAVLASTRGRGTCRDCGAPMTWYRTVVNDKAMPFNADPVPVSRAVDNLNRQVLELDAADTHWKSCPNAKQFRRAR